jgi:hypothetical protein
MKKVYEINTDIVGDRIKQTLLCESIPTYKWMYELGLNATQLGVYAYIFNILKREPLNEHYIKTKELVELFRLTPQNLQHITSFLANKGLLYKRIEGKGNQSKPYYSLFQPV